MTNSEENIEQATCVYCGGKYPKERAEIGYDYCMQKACTARGKKSAVVDMDWTAADTARF